MPINKNKLISCALISIILTGCSSTERRYLFADDKAPEESSVPTLDHIEDAVPKIEESSPQGNKDYSINGQDYSVWTGIKEYQETGGASWYGEKFHGHLTSNGEIYDMYSMSGAHKNLPLPSYVRVTNLANQRQVVVRINDRGPFHDDRILDLSYAAAYKLGIIDTGTGTVEVELIQPEETQMLAEPIAAPRDPDSLVNPVSIEIQTTPPPATPLESLDRLTSGESLDRLTAGDEIPMPVEDAEVNFIQVAAPVDVADSTRVDLSKYYVQLVAAKDKSRMSEMASTLSEQGYHYVISQIGGLNKLWLGPYESQREAQQVQSQMNRGAYKDAFIVNPKSR